MVGGHKPIKIALFESFLIRKRYSLKNIQLTVTSRISNSTLLIFFMNISIKFNLLNIVFFSEYLK